MTSNDQSRWEARVEREWKDITSNRPVNFRIDLDKSKPSEWHFTIPPEPILKSVYENTLFCFKIELAKGYYPRISPILYFTGPLGIWHPALPEEKDGPQELDLPHLKATWNSECFARDFIECFVTQLANMLKARARWTPQNPEASRQFAAAGGYPKKLYLKKARQSLGLDRLDDQHISTIIRQIDEARYANSWASSNNKLKHQMELMKERKFENVEQKNRWRIERQWVHGISALYPSIECRVLTSEDSVLELKFMLHKELGDRFPDIRCYEIFSSRISKALDDHMILGNLHSRPSYSSYSSSSSSSSSFFVDTSSSSRSCSVTGRLFYSYSPYSLARADTDDCMEAAQARNVGHALKQFIPKVLTHTILEYI